MEEFEDHNLSHLLKETCSESLLEKILNFNNKTLYKTKNENDGHSKSFVDRTHEENPFLNNNQSQESFNAK